VRELRGELSQIGFVNNPHRRAGLAYQHYFSVLVSRRFAFAELGLDSKEPTMYMANKVRYSRATEAVRRWHKPPAIWYCFK
jgi:hypothetical protein